MPPSWQSLEEAEGEVAFIQHLAAKGVPVAAPVASAGGRYVEVIDSSLGACLALAFEEAPGYACDDLEWSPEQAREAGRLMARLHVAAQDFVLPPGCERETWRDELDGTLDDLPASEGALRDVLLTARERMHALLQTPDVYGMVHFDLSGDNLVFDGATATVIDFDDCVEHWYIGDIARTVATFRTNDNGLEGAIEAALLEGYREVRAIGHDWEELLALFVQVMHIAELAWLLRARDQSDGRVPFDAHAERLLRRLIAAGPG